MNWLTSVHGWLAGSIITASRYCDAMNCDLIHDQHGWWLQYEKGDKRISYLLDCTDSLDAQLAAQEDGFNVMTVWEGDKQIGKVCIPKEVETKGLA